MACPTVTVLVISDGGGEKSRQRHEVIAVKCKRCGREISNNESYEYLGETLCEDCYIDIKYPAKACDPWAVYAATCSRESLGLKGAEGLTDLHFVILLIFGGKNDKIRVSVDLVF